MTKRKMLKSPFNQKMQRDYIKLKHFKILKIFSEIFQLALFLLFFLLKAMSLPPHPTPLPSLPLPPPPLPLLTTQHLPPPATFPLYTHHPPIPSSITLPPQYLFGPRFGSFPSQPLLSFPSTTHSTPQTNYTTPITHIPSSILPTPKPPTLTTHSHT